MKRFLKTYLVLLLLLLPLAQATAPTITSLTPGNNSVIFVNSTANVTATDAESNPINYTFSVIPGVLFINSTWQFSGFSNDPGSGYDDLNEVQCQGAGCTGRARRTANITTDYLHVRLQSESNQGACPTNTSFEIDDVDIDWFTGPGGDVASKNFTLNISAFNDGALHVIDIELSATCGLAGTFNSRWWFDQWYVGRTNVSDNSKTIHKQNGTSTTFKINTNELDSRLGPWKLGVTAYDNNTEFSYTENVLHIASLDSCTEGGTPLYLYNFSHRDEKTGFNLPGTIDTSLELTHANSFGGQTATYNEGYSNDTNHLVCQWPSTINLTLQEFITHQPSLPDYTVDRFYYFTNAVTDPNPSNIVEIVLYGINDTIASTITTTVKRSGTGIQDLIIKLLRFDVSTGTSQTVQMCKTDTEGKCPLLAELNNQLYNFVIIDGNNTLLTTSPAIITSQSLTINLPASSTDPSKSFRQVQGVTYDLNYNNNTNTFTCTYSDDDNEQLTVNLKVDEIKTISTTLINQSSVVSDAGTIQLVVPNINGTTYRATCEATFTDGSTSTLDILIVTIPGGEFQWGLMGWFLFAFTAIALSTVFIGNPMAVLQLNALNLFAHKILGTIPITWSTALGLIFVLFMIGMYTRLDRR